MARILGGRSKAILILGAAVWADGPSPTLRRRTEEGARLFHAGQADLIIPCGGMGRYPPTEAEMMARLLRDAGVPASAIRLEDRSTNTVENIRFAVPILTELGRDRVILVSDAYHLPRAALIARREGLIASGSAPATAGTRVWPRIRGWLREGPALAALLLRLR